MAEQNTLEENKELIRRWFEEVWNKGRADAIAEMMAEDAVAHGLSDDAACLANWTTPWDSFFPSMASRLTGCKLIRREGD